MQRKESCYSDLKLKFLTHTSIAFYDTESSFKDTLIRKTLFFGNIPVSMCPKFTKSCIILSGIYLEGLICTEEHSSFKIDENTREFIYIISASKLFVTKSKYNLYIYKLKTFVEKEKILEIYLRFFKVRPYLLAESVQDMFKIHKKRKFQIKKRYYQSELIVNFIHFLTSRIHSDSNISLTIHFIRTLYYLFTFFKTYSSKNIFSYFKNNSYYFLVYNLEHYEQVFESEFVVVTDFNN